jgi:phage terminase small subunit
MGPLANQRHERFAHALAQGKTAAEAYVLAGYKANDGNAIRLKGNERISARVHEIVGCAAEPAEVSLERVLRELAAIAFSNVTKAVTWWPSVQVREEKHEGGQRVKVVTSAVSLVPKDKLDAQPPPSPRCRRVRRGHSASGCMISWRPSLPWAST